MKPGPLRRLAGSAGLLALAPTAYLLWTEALTPGDAALRAAATLAAVMVVSRMAAWWVRSVATQFERRADDPPSAESRPQRRRSD